MSIEPRVIVLQEPTQPPPPGGWSQFAEVPCVMQKKKAPPPEERVAGLTAHITESRKQTRYWWVYALTVLAIHYFSSYSP